MSDSRATVVRASAGTGKTFRLAHRYLGLLLGGAQPEEILATTFTRKAAGEILGRILTRLAAAARDESARREMLTHLEPKPAREPSAKDCAALLQALLARLHAFQVRTMDSWFVHLARLHGPELGLPPAWSVLEPAEAQAQAADEAAALIEDFDEARVRDLLRELQQQEFRRGVHEGLVELTSGGLEILRDSSEGAWTAVGAGAAPEAAAVQALLEKLAFPSGKRWSAVADKLQRALEERDWATWLLAGPVKNLRAGDDTYYGNPMPAEVIRLLERGTEIAQAALLHERARRLAAAHALLVEADARVEAARLRAGVFAFDDFPRWLESAALASEEAAFRLDGRLRHVLLDEFQDTASPQWRALAPLVGAALGAEKGTLFCVGDGKQSIYGWRSGEPRLLGAIAEQFHAKTEPLAKSFRTAQVVLDEVNQVFGGLPASVAEWSEDEALQCAGERFAEHWDAHSTAREGLSGRFELWVIPVADDQREADAVRPAAMARAVAIAEELRAAGRPEATVAILARKNSDVAAMVTALRAQGVEASAEGNVALTESHLVSSALAALDLADHPEDTASARLLAVSPLRALLRAKEDLHARARREERAAFAQRLRRAVQTEGVGAWLAKLHAQCVGAGRMDLDARRFARLVEAGHEWDGRVRSRAGTALRLSAFADAARALRMEDPSPATVRVMTVHKAKGLEFDAVVLALTGGRRRNGPPFWTERADPAAPRSGVAFAGNAATHGADERLDALERETKASSWYDELCVLYVGMTRAKQRLEIVLPQAASAAVQKGESTFAFSLARLIRRDYRVITGSAEEPIHASGAARGDWGKRPTTASKAPSSVAAGQAWPESVVVRSAAPPAMRPRWTASHAGKEAAAQLHYLAAEPREDARPRGIAIHRLFEEIEWVEDFHATDEQLLAALQDLDDPPAEADARRWVEDFRGMLAKPKLRAALTRPQGVPAARLSVWRERRFAITLPEPDRSEPAILRGSFDRVVLIGPAGKPTSATILDFKTGEVPDAETERAKREAYEPQMQVYREALERLTGITASRIHSDLCFVE